MPGRERRVLHVLYQLERSGAEMMLLQSAPEWQRRGYSLDLLATGPEVGPMQPTLAQAGFLVHHIPFRSALRYLPCRRFIPDFLGLLHRRQYDVLHLHTEAAMPLYIALGSLADLPTIVRTVHSAFPFTGLLRTRKRIERSLARSAGVRFGFVSESVAQVEADYFGNHGVHTPNWFNVEHFRPPSDQERAEARRALKCDDQSLVVLTVGNCSEIKNHELLLRSLALLAPRHPNLVYLHVGREPDHRAERKLAAELGLDAVAHFVGSHPDPRVFLWAADLFVMCSLREGLGNAALEAVGAGSPALFTRTQGLCDIARRAQWIPEVGFEPEAMAAAIDSFAQIPRPLARARALSDSGIIHREYSIEGGVDCLARGLYRDAQSTPSPVPSAFARVEAL